MTRILNICGARPNFMKIAPLMRAYKQHPGVDAKLVHTGQHYDAAMSKLFFEQLELPEPDVNLQVGSGSHAQQTAAIMQKFEPVVLEYKPDWVVVVGDVNSTVACALVATKLGVKVAHVEAGLRSFDRTMPEEINRIVVDSISDLLLVSEPSGVENLRREGVADAKVKFVGNVMIDTLLQHRERSKSSTVLRDLELSPKGYVTVTLHRPSNVDDPASLRRLLGVFEQVGKEMPVVFVVHPRTRGKLAEIEKTTPLPKGLRLVDPLGYLDFLAMTDNSFAVLTDSGGIQEETTVLGVPCLTLRENTERPVTITQGTNHLVGTDPTNVLHHWSRLKQDSRTTPSRPRLWDGQAAKRILHAILAESIRV
jgi:UDP-N-acetylglucosamine 2-epimerase (non-hydrolysing)